MANKSDLRHLNGHAAHYGDKIAYLHGFDLHSDYTHPRQHRAYWRDEFRKVRCSRVVVDHNATGTATTGTGDTVLRAVPKDWKSGDRRFAN